MLHCTIFRAPLRARVPTVVTVHDLAVLRHPEVFPLWTRLYGRAALRWTIRTAGRVIAVSEFSRREVVELAGVDPDRIDVVPNAVEPVFRADGPAAEGDYVLAVGTLEPRKNLVRVIDAAGRAGVELRVVGVLAAGGASTSRAGVRRLGFVPDEELARLYRGARCARLPVALRRLRHPRAEAMACGTPVVTSRESAMAEVVGDAAVLVDPLDAASIAAGIEEAERRRDELDPARPGARSPLHVGAGRRRSRRTPTARRSREPTRRRRRGRARAPPHGRRDVRLEPPARARGARARRRSPHRGRDPEPRARSGRHRAAGARDAGAGAADALDAAAAAPAQPAPPSSTPSTRFPLGSPVPGRRHDPRPLVRARAGAHGAQGPPRLPARRPAGGAARRAGPHRLRADEARPRSSSTAFRPTGSS